MKQNTTVRSVGQSGKDRKLALKSRKTPEGDCKHFFLVQFPLLSYMARVLFALQAGNSKSEMVFSATGIVVIPTRPDSLLS